MNGDRRRTRIESADSLVEQVPTTMGTQHPDSASRYVSVQEEPDEAVEVLTPQPDGLGIEEFMVDFEGKSTPYHQPAEVAHRLIARGLVPGEHVWLTPRIPSAGEETVFRQMMALMSVIEADYDIHRANPLGCIREVILPMVSAPEDMVSLRRRIHYLFELARQEFGLDQDPDSLQVIPLIENVPGMLSFSKLLTGYLDGCAEAGLKVPRIRPMIARSDSAMSYGHVAAVIAGRVMLSEAYQVSADRGISVMPILGGGTLPFRGHVSPENLPGLVAAFPGVRTVTVQSGLRYDHPPDEVRRFVQQAKDLLVPPASPPIIPVRERRILVDAALLAAAAYLRKQERYVRLVRQVESVVPLQRDRLSSRSGVSYARKGAGIDGLLPLASGRDIREAIEASPGEAVSGTPRAIAFTSALYSVGMPPEFIALHEAFAAIRKHLGEEGLEIVLRYAPGLRADFETAARHLSLESVEQSLGRRVADAARKSVASAEELFSVRLTGERDERYTTILEMLQPLIRLKAQGRALDDEDDALLRTFIVRLGKMRGSLG